jgi:hypothetical protein
MDSYESLFLKSSASSSGRRKDEVENSKRDTDRLFLPQPLLLLVTAIHLPINRLNTHRPLVLLLVIPILSTNATTGNLDDSLGTHKEPKY